MSEHDTYGQAGDWLIGAAKRNPEALLVLAAGAALFLRGRNGQASPSRSYGAQTSPSRSYYDDEASRQPTSGRASGPLSRVAEGASGLAEGAKDYASDVTERISSTAGSYASAVSKFADDTRQTVTSQASRFAGQAQSTVQHGFAQMLREQPLALAGLGLAADAEEQAFGPAREALMSAANQVGDSVKSAAGEAGEQLKQAVSDKGLNTDALKGLARDVAGNFTNKVAGTDEERSPGLVPEGTASSRGGMR